MAPARVALAAVAAACALLPRGMAAMLRPQTAVALADRDCKPLFDGGNATAVLIWVLNDLQQGSPVGAFQLSSPVMRAACAYPDGLVQFNALLRSEPYDVLLDGEGYEIVHQGREGLKVRQYFALVKVFSQSVPGREETTFRFQLVLMAKDVIDMDISLGRFKLPPNHREVWRIDSIVPWTKGPPTTGPPTTKGKEQRALPLPGRSSSRRSSKLRRLRLNMRSRNSSAHNQSNISDLTNITTSIRHSSSKHFATTRRNRNSTVGGRKKKKKKTKGPPTTGAPK